MKKINLKKRAQEVEKAFSPQVVGEVNETYVKIARINGDDVPWHDHKNEDELFYILKGKLLFEEEGREPFRMKKGDMYIVKRGVKHRVSSTDDCYIMLIEPKSTLHTGDVKSKISKSIEQQLKYHAN